MMDAEGNRQPLTVIIQFWFCLISAVLLYGCMATTGRLPDKTVDSVKINTGPFMNKGNPIIRDKFTADPTAIVKGGTVYLITGHDEAPIGTEKYVMHDWLCYSSTDMVNWTDHGSIFAATDFKWSDGHAYASNIIEHLGKYFFFAAVSHSTIPGAAIGVAISEDPTKKFKDARGSALITHNMLPPTDNTKANLDPSVLIDDDGSAYIFWGNKTCYFSKLTPNLIALDSSIQTINLPKFEEGAHIHKHNSWYYLLYGYGMPEKVAYAMSQNIYGPWEFKGIVNDIPRNCETNRPCIVDYKGKSYFIYHNGTLKNGGSHRRSVCIDYLHYNSDGTIQKVIMTTEGVNRD